MYNLLFTYISPSITVSQFPLQAGKKALHASITSLFFPS